MSRAKRVHCASAQGQGGVALISVLLVVAIATTLSVSMITRQNLTVHRARNFLEQGQAYQYALGGEELARQILRRDFEENGGTDHLGEPWAQDIAPFEFEEGEVLIQITDLQGLINLNSLGAAGSQGTASAARFRLLLEGLGIDPALTDRVADWIDADQSTRAEGAEDYDYLDDEPPHRTPAGPMGDSSELRMLVEMDGEEYANLLSYVTVLPDSNTSLNVNTAPPVILQTIASDLSLGAAQVLVEQRDAEGGYESVAEFLQQTGVTGGGGVQSAGLSVSSSFFRVDVRARYHSRISTLSSVIQRDAADGALRVIARDLGRPFIPRLPADDAEPASSE